MAVSILDFVQNVSTQIFRKGDTIFRQGEPSNGIMYFIFNGEVAIYKNRNNEMEEIGKMKPGAFFGEMALLNAQPRAATIIVNSSIVKLGILDHRTFLKLSRTTPAFLYGLLKTVIARLAKAEKRAEELQKQLDG
jgi:CRP-like cAMP-binding protein